MTHIGPIVGYHRINREERNHVAILYHLLLHRSTNLEHFLKVTLERPDVDASSCELYLEFALLRDRWHNLNEDGRRALLEFHLPTVMAERKGLSIEEVNRSFAVRSPKPSKTEIQSPANWVASRIQGLDTEMTKAVHELKWCFNLKPDLVIVTKKGQVICIEAKVESGQGRYTCDLPKGGTHSINQQCCQEIMFTRFLGVEAPDLQMVLLGKNSSTKSRSLPITWSKAFAGLDPSGSHPFVERWLKENEVYPARAARTMRS